MVFVGLVSKSADVGVPAPHHGSAAGPALAPESATGAGGTDLAPDPDHAPAENIHTSEFTSNFNLTLSSISLNLRVCMLGLHGTEIVRGTASTVHLSEDQTG